MKITKIFLTSFTLLFLNQSICFSWITSTTKARALKSCAYLTQKSQEELSFLHDADGTLGKRQSQDHLLIGSKLIHWRGEKSHGNSLKFRHAELKAVLCTVLDVKDLDVKYANALSTSFDESLEMSEYQIEVYQNAIQYVHVFKHDADNEREESHITISKEKWIEVIQRCSLIRGFYELVAEGDSIEDLATNALKLKTLDDMFPYGINEDATWRVRLRQYGSTASPSKSKQYGKKMRSPMRKEREAVNQLKELLIRFGGNVDLKDADISIYIFEGLLSSSGEEGRKFLARFLTKGGLVDDGTKPISTIAPITRKCVTNTPLAPIEAFTVCNIARIRNGDRVLDPFAGSCTTLLAASMLASKSLISVGIEIAHNGQVNRDHILEDFHLRNLTEPALIIHGDAMNPQVRIDAISAAGNEPFDSIITDPPYGIREKTGYCEDPPLVNLVKCIANDKNSNNRLLRKDGRLVAFVPNVKGEDVMSSMPTDDELEDAGLVLCQMLEQPLNDSLSRWLVEYVCID